MTQALAAHLIASQHDRQNPLEIDTAVSAAELLGHGVLNTMAPKHLDVTRVGTAARFSPAEIHALKDAAGGGMQQIILRPPDWRDRLGELEGRDRPIYSRWFSSTVALPKQSDPAEFGLSYIAELSQDAIVAKLIKELLENTRKGLSRAGVLFPDVELHLSWRMTATTSSHDFEILRIRIPQKHVTERDWERLRANEAGVREYGFGYLGNYVLRHPGRQFGMGGLGLFYLVWLNRHRPAVLRFTKTEEGELLTELFIALPYPSGAKPPRSRLSSDDINHWKIWRRSDFSTAPVKEDTRQLIRALDEHGKLGPLILDAGSGDRLSVTRFLSEKGHKVLGVRVPQFTGETPLRLSDTAMIAPGDIQNLDETITSPEVESFLGSPGALFDAVVASDLLYYVDYAQVIEEILPHLKPGGRLIIVLAPLNGDWDRRASHPRGLSSVPDPVKALRALGLEIETSLPPDPDRMALDTRFRIVARKPAAAPERKTRQSGTLGLLISAMTVPSLTALMLAGAAMSVSCTHRSTIVNPPPLSVPSPDLLPGEIRTLYQQVHGPNLAAAVKEAEFWSQMPLTDRRIAIAVLRELMFLAMRPDLWRDRLLADRMDAVLMRMISRPEAIELLKALVLEFSQKGITGLRSGKPGIAPVLVWSIREQVDLAPLARDPEVVNVLGQMLQGALRVSPTTNINGEKYALQDEIINILGRLLPMREAREALEQVLYDLQSDFISDRQKKRPSAQEKKRLQQMEERIRLIENLLRPPRAAPGTALLGEAA